MTGAGCLRVFHPAIVPSGEQLFGEMGSGSRISLLPVVMSRVVVRTNARYVPSFKC